MPAPWLMDSPQQWDSYLPQTDDYESAEDYIAALQAGSEDTSAKIGEYWDPIAGVMRGGKATERGQALRKLEWAFNEAVRRGGKGSTMIALHNAIGMLDPETLQMAYQAHDEYGNSRLDPALLAMIERLGGVGPMEQPGGVAPDMPDLGLPPDDRPFDPRPIQGGAVDSGFDPRAVQGGAVDPRLGMDPRVGGQVIPDQPVYLDPVLDAPVNAAPPVEQPGYDPYNPPGSDPNAPPYMEPPYVNPGPQGAGSGVVIGGVEIPMTTIERIRRKYGRDMRPSGLGPY